MSLCGFDADVAMCVGQVSAVFCTVAAPPVYQNEPGSGHGHVLDYKLGL